MRASKAKTLTASSRITADTFLSTGQLERFGINLLPKFHPILFRTILACTGSVDDSSTASAKSPSISRISRGGDGQSKMSCKQGSIKLAKWRSRALHPSAQLYYDISPSSSVEPSWRTGRATFVPSQEIDERRLLLFGDHVFLALTPAKTGARYRSRIDHA